MEKTTVICVLKLGGDFSSIYVERLQNAVKRHLNRQYEFICLTDDVTIDFCKTIPLKHGWKGWWSKIELFRPDLGLGTCLYFDLDTLIVGNIDKLITIAQQTSFSMLRGFHKHKGKEYLASGIMAGDFTTQAEVYRLFKKNPEYIISQIQSRGRSAGMQGDQGFITIVVDEDVSKLQESLPVGYIVGKRLLHKNVINITETNHVVAWSGKPRFHKMKDEIKDYWK